MCGRFAFYSPREAVEALFGVSLANAWAGTRAGDAPGPRWNIAPSLPVLGLRQGASGDLEPAWFRWGLVPFWAKDPAIGNRMINARVETLDEKPAFRQALTRRRCVVLADGFYEWRADAGGKTPCWISRRDHQPFAMAGLWERWEKGGPETEPLETCTLVTTAARGGLRDIHDRMPVILEPGRARAWVTAPPGPPAELLALLEPVPDSALTAVAVSRAVNNPRHEGPALIEPAPPPASP